VGFGAAMHWTRAITAGTVILVACASGTEGASLPRFSKGTPYAEARQSLKALNYRPNVLPDADAVSRARCAGGSDDMRCFPEMIACAGTGLGQCVYSWRRGEALIDVFTTNEMPLVEGVKCRVNC
jgi:hypothetical protein